MTASLKPSISFTVYLELTESEARVLELLSQYDNEDVVIALSKISSSFSKSNIGSLMDNIRKTIRPQIHTIDRAQKVLSEALNK